MPIATPSIPSGQPPPPRPGTSLADELEGQDLTGVTDAETPIFDLGHRENPAARTYQHYRHETTEPDELRATVSRDGAEKIRLRAAAFTKELAKRALRRRYLAPKWASDTIRPAVRPVIRCGPLKEPRRGSACVVCSGSRG